MRLGMMPWKLREASLALTRNPDGKHEAQTRPESRVRFSVQEQCQR